MSTAQGNGGGSGNGNGNGGPGGGAIDLEALGISPDVLWMMRRDLDRLESASALDRLRACETVARDGRHDAVPALRRLLDHDAPILLDGLVFEVRQSALVALPRLSWAGKQ